MRAADPIPAKDSDAPITQRIDALLKKIEDMEFVHNLMLKQEVLGRNNYEESVRDLRICRDAYQFKMEQCDYWEDKYRMAKRDLHDARALADRNEMDYESALARAKEAEARVQWSSYPPTELDADDVV